MFLKWYWIGTNEADDAKDLRLVHVATFNMHDPIARYNSNPSQLTHKVSLDIYRKASLNIFKIFQNHCTKVQKAGLDEAFLDVTDIVNSRLIKRYAAEISDDSAEEFPYEINWEQLGFLALSDEESKRLYAGARKDFGRFLHENEREVSFTHSDSELIKTLHNNTLYFIT